MAAGEYYADHVRRELSVQACQAADIETVQSLLLLGMYEWGEGVGFSAWMYVGERD